ISGQQKALNISIPFNGVHEASKAVHGKLNIVNVWKQVPEIQFAQATKEGGDFAHQSLKAAEAALKNGDIDVLVTAPN
ncbi:4-hydroxythreonine-4-phosphate dehydrogenase PdxA, partial [Maribacter flavus]|uniref:4-hydroxythreonine-4-phosphate dehydrogenase PdxA n=1 Tax=Maribacter flavus TaxID=1658664 RepID=UPI003D3371D5